MVNTRKALTAAFASLAAALVGWQFTAVAFAPHNALAASAGTTANQLSAPAAPTSPDTTSPNTTSPNTTTPSTTAPSGLRNGTVTGQSVDTQYGAVQVKVVVASGSISDVVAVQLTNRGGESVQISNYAAPILRSEVLQSQSAKVSGVSGATYTSEAYLGSLQSALDQMGK